MKKTQGCNLCLWLFLSNKECLAYVVVVCWSASKPSTLMIQVQILLTTNVSALHWYEKTEINEKRPGMTRLKKLNPPDNIILHYYELKAD